MILQQITGRIKEQRTYYIDPWQTTDEICLGYNKAGKRNQQPKHSS